MHQIFYIDVEEEISSVIDRLNKSASTDNYFVVPKRAIFLQSIVNLKLLKREADKLDKKVVIVTQDELGSSMAQRCGLEVQASLDNSESFEDVEVEELEESDFEKESQEESFEEDNAVVESQNKMKRLKTVGSSGFYESIDSLSVKTSSAPQKISLQKKKDVVLKISDNMNGIKKAGKGIVGHQTRKNIQDIGGFPGYTKKTEKSFFSGINDIAKEKTIEKMFSSSRDHESESKKEVHVVGGNAKKIFLAFILLCAFIFSGVAAYLFLPSAKIIISPNVLNVKSELVIVGNAGIENVNDKNIPIRVIEKEESASLTYDVVGGGGGVGKKAHGKVVLYNEYSSSDQTLVATTRLESADGKIFRLVKNVVVPGTVTVGGESKPGAIEAEVVADEAGPDFNISATSFKIPGFKDGPKYEKFYAKSMEAFTGGSNEGGSSSNTVSQKDIDNAKQKTESFLKEKISKAIIDEIGEGEVLLDQAKKVTIVKGASSVKVGNVANSFEYNSTVSMKVLVFLEKDIRGVVENAVKREQNLENAKWEISKLEYGAVVADFDKNTLELKVHYEVSLIPDIDSEKIKNELLGKRDDQLNVSLKNYTTLKNVSVEFWPTFVSRIPQYSSRVSVEIENNAK